MRVLCCADTLLMLLWLGALAAPIRSFSPSSKHASVSKVHTRTKPHSIAATASRDGEPAILNQANLMRKDAIALARSNDYSSGLRNIRYLFSLVERAHDEPSRRQLLHITEEAIGSFTNLAFSKPFRGPTASRRVKTGLEAIQLQLSSLPAPYDEVPRRTFLNALRALSGVISSGPVAKERNVHSTVSAETAFRILQRLLTGVGVRNTPGANQTLSERDFNALLNAVVNIGRMDVAEKVVSLQEKTPAAPLLSPVTYSILLKGYGRRGDIGNVDSVLDKAYANCIVPDTVMLNSVLDAMVNCNEVGKARAVFDQIVKQADNALPNVRTYNTMLKGFAQSGALEECVGLTNTMKENSLWDAVTTNTLVSAAVIAGDFRFAEGVLAEHTSPENAGPASSRVSSRRKRDHPNVQAYTALLDGYAKSGNLDKALGTLQHMRKKGVSPNEYTYTCMIAGLAKGQRIAQAKRMLDFMESGESLATAVTYNAFISALVESGSRSTRSKSEAKSEDRGTGDPLFVEETIGLLRRMMENGVRPTVSTISILLKGFAKCPNARVNEANAIIERFETDGIIPVDDARVSTALIGVYGAAQDAKGALAIFRRIENPDIAAVNAFLDAVCRCGELQIALETFDHLFLLDSNSPLSPDVITYSTLISSQLRLKTSRGSRKVQELYRDMKKRRVSPDIALVDRILSAMTRGDRIGLQKKDVQFTLGVLRDAEVLPWKQGELEHRKQAVRAIVSGKMREIWKENEEYYGINGDAEPEDELFRKKGWNKMDSGFRMWGSDGNSISVSEPESKGVDDFLASKGWNDVDSGFRLF